MKNIVRTAVGKYWPYLPLLTLTSMLVTMPAHAEALRASVPTGSWGGDHIRLVVTQAGASVEYDCAFGSINGPLLLDKAGNFDVRGIHGFESGGPRELGAPAPKQHAARYRGWTDGSQMRLTVTLRDTGVDLGAFSLGLGRRPHLEKCL